MERFDSLSDFVEWSQDIHSEVSIGLNKCIREYIYIYTYQYIYTRYQYIYIYIILYDISIDYLQITLRCPISLKVPKTVPTHVETAKYAKPIVVEDRSTTVEIVAFRATVITNNIYNLFPFRDHGEVEGKITAVRFSDVGSNGTKTEYLF